MSERMSEDEKVITYKDNCPVCKTPWTKTPKSTITGCYWHCLSCKKKAEDLKAVDKPLWGSSDSSSSSMLDQFEDMLSDDDEDFWGFNYSDKVESDSHVLYELPHGYVVPGYKDE